MQSLELEKIERVRFEGFDGPVIVDLLKLNRTVWHGVLFSDLNLARICDLANDKWDCYTLYILSADDKLDAARALSVLFGAEDIHGLSPFLTAELLSLPPTNKKSLVTLKWWD